MSSRSTVETSKNNRATHPNTDETTHESGQVTPPFSLDRRQHLVRHCLVRRRAEALGIPKTRHAVCRNDSHFAEMASARHLQQFCSPSPSFSPSRDAPPASRENPVVAEGVLFTVEYRMEDGRTHGRFYSLEHFDRSSGTQRQLERGCLRTVVPRILDHHPDTSGKSWVSDEDYEDASRLLAKREDDSP